MVFDSFNRYGILFFLHFFLFCSIVFNNFNRHGTSGNWLRFSLFGISLPFFLFPFFFFFFLFCFLFLGVLDESNMFLPCLGCGLLCCRCCVQPFFFISHFGSATAIHRSTPFTLSSCCSFLAIWNGPYVVMLKNTFGAGLKCYILQKMKNAL